MQLRVLTETVLIGGKRYEPGTVVETLGPLHVGTRDECFWVSFSNGSGTFLDPTKLTDHELRTFSGRS